MIKIYHNPRCRKSRAGVEYLNDNNKDFETVEYLKQTLTIDELSKLLKKLNVPVLDLVRKQESYYKSDLKGKTFTERQWLEILAKNPKLIRRPIIETEKKAIIAEDLSVLDSFFN
ncbi:MAG: hypothetical protein PHP31_04970 [Lentimicrobiaceae bacterium]|nr:hypothetical protein [Lentimicrobiaceae bacterium]